MRGAVLHTWTIKQGKSFTGYFVSVDAANVVVKDDGGKLFSLPSNSLIEEDKQIADLILSVQTTAVK
jgi:hypothetical protein